MDAAPHVRLQATLAAAENAVAALLTECQQPDVRAALEVRARVPALRDGLRRAATHAARARNARDSRLAHKQLLTRLCR